MRRNLTAVAWTGALAAVGMLLCGLGVTGSAGADQSDTQASTAVTATAGGSGWLAAPPGWGGTASGDAKESTRTLGTNSLLGSLGTPPKNEFAILMNYELGMHCTGFEFSYCCVLPPYNSIEAQVVKTDQAGLLNGSAFPRLVQADPDVGLDFLGRPTVLRDTQLDANGNFKKYVLRYWHDAQPRNDGRGAPQLSTLISNVEGNSLLMWNTILCAAKTSPGGPGNPPKNALEYGTYDNQLNVQLGECGPYITAQTQTNAQDNYANAWLNHLYIYSDLSGSNPTNTSLEANKIRLGSLNLNSNVQFSTVVPQNSGPAFHPMGPGSTPGLENVLTSSGNTGTIVFTQSKVLENVPIMLTSPRIWEALGLPLTPFEDTINFFGNPGAISESTVRPFVQMKAQLMNYDPTQPGGIGTAVLDSSGNPIIGMGDAPIDIPNCERCHALPAGASVNSPQNNWPDAAARVQEEIDFWNTYYNIDTAAGDSDWYSRLKGAAISILTIHDDKHGTAFTANYPQTGQSGLPQTTRLGHETVMCQKCHADNVIARLRSGNVGVATPYNDPVGTLIPPLTEAIHDNHDDRPFNDSLGRNGLCQGCHPAHRSDGDMTNYPITAIGTNAFANGDNRDAAGGCYVGRDVHANRSAAYGGGPDLDGVQHLNALGKWLMSNVVDDTGTYKGIWCTNCHTQLSQELWRYENVPDLVHAYPGEPGNVREPKKNATLADVASAVGLSLSQAEAWLDPKTDAATWAVWNDPGLANPRSADANIATIEIGPDGNPVINTDGDGDPSVVILDFCTTPDCVAAAQAKLPSGYTAAAVPFSAATDGRDHWLSPGEPHCADCHTPPFVEQSGNINAFLPFNYPRKASLFRYSRGHRDITCQGCHESTHGLYPVTTVDTTTYAQAAGLNTDGTHGPLKCGACHTVQSNGTPSFLAVDNIQYDGKSISSNFDTAVTFAHSFTNEDDPRQNVCVGCHKDFSSQISSTNWEWLIHPVLGAVSRNVADQVETEQLGHVAGDPAAENPLATVCVTCHADESAQVNCSNIQWKQHITYGAVAHKVYEYVSDKLAGSTCGW